MENETPQKIADDTLCRLIAVKTLKKIIIQFFLKFKIGEEEYIVFSERNGKILEMSDSGNSLLGPAVTEHGFMVLSDEIRNKTFEYKDKELFLENIEKML